MRDKKFWLQKSEKNRKQKYLLSELEIINKLPQPFKHLLNCFLFLFHIRMNIEV